MKKVIAILFVFVAIYANSSTYYLSPTGNDTTGDGTISSPWFTLNKAWTVVAAGDTVYMRGGTYEYDERQLLTGVSGTSGNYIHVFNYPDESPTITMGASYGGYYWNMIYATQVDYIHLKGLEIRDIYNNSETEHFGSALYFSYTNYCIWENINYHGNGLPAIIRYEINGNLILNSDFHHQYDPWNDYGDGDGLNVSHSALGSENIIRGCRFWNNSDDGVDVWASEGNIIIDNCWSWNNGYKEDGVTTGGDGTGIKLGQTNEVDSTVFARTVKNCLSFYNRNHGISSNNAECAMYIYNNTVYSCNPGFYHSPSWTDAPNIIRNNIAYNNSTYDYNWRQSLSMRDYNAWNTNPTGYDAQYSVSSSDFASLDSTGVSGPRQADGSLPVINFLRLAEGSKLIDAGVDLGIPYNGTAPDLGAFEYKKKNTENTPIYITEDISICEGDSYHGWTISGQYKKFLKTVDGADSIVITNLWVNPVVRVSEEIEITTGENYLGWTESGMYERTIKSVTGCDSIVITHLIVLINTITEDDINKNKYISEEITICEGDSYHGWATSGQYQRILNTADGADSIVTTQLTVTPLIQVSEEVKIWEGESYNGWTTTGQYERIFSSVTGCDSVIITHLRVEPLQNQLIELTGGWNIFSSYLNPLKKNFDDVFEHLKTNKLLIEVQDENGKTYRDSDEKWINEIGEIQESEGYRIRVDSSCTLELKGQLVEFPLNIQLFHGFNIISFPYLEEKDAMKVIQPLIDDGILEKVQDERGNSIENWGNLMGWINGIGNFIPGEGYVVEVNKDGVLSLPEEFEKSGLILSGQHDETSHFKKIFEGNGFGHMSINVTGLDVLNLKAGDEIAAFDGNLCIGAVRLSETNVSNNIASLQASASDKDLLNGFNEGNPVHLRVWLNSTELEFQVQPEVIKGNNLYQKHGSVFFNLLEDKKIESTEHSLIGVNVFPNPTNEKVTIQFSVLPESEIIIILTDMTGKLITSRIVKSLTEYLHVGSQPSGVYFLKIFQKDFFVIKKLMIH